MQCGEGTWQGPHYSVKRKRMRLAEWAWRAVMAFFSQNPKNGILQFPILSPPIPAAGSSPRAQNMPSASGRLGRIHCQRKRLWAIVDLPPHTRFVSCGRPYRAFCRIRPTENAKLHLGNDVPVSSRMVLVLSNSWMNLVGASTHTDGPSVACHNSCALSSCRVCGAHKKRLSCNVPRQIAPSLATIVTGCSLDLWRGCRKRECRVESRSTINAETCRDGHVVSFCRLKSVHVRGNR